jgi:copper chaperone CopZ
MTAITLHISGMTCEHCVRAVENALNAIPGIAARVSLEEKLARIEAEPGIDIERLVHAVEEEGYSATPAQDKGAGNT